MNKLSLIIADYDEIYLDYLNKFLSNTYKGKFEITCFSQEDILLESISSIRKKDVLLINKDMYDSNKESLQAQVVLQLVEGNEVINEVEDKVVHKYRDIKNIYDMILKEYIVSNPKKTTKVYAQTTETKVISIYSPVGGSGKSTIAAGISSYLASSGNKVFYLNLEDIQSTDIYFSGDGHTSLSDIIFEVKDKGSGFINKLSTSINKDNNTGVMYLNSTENILDIEDMNEEDIKWLLEELLKEKVYDYIVIDTVSKYNSVYDVILNTSNVVITPVINTKSSIVKLEKFIKNQSDINKYYFVENMKYDNSEINVPTLKYLNSQVSISIYEDKSLNRASGYQVINSQTIRTAVEEIIEQLEL